MKNEILKVDNTNVNELANMIYADILNGMCSFNDLYDLYNINKTGLMKIVSVLKQRGYNIDYHTDYVTKEVYLKNYGHQSLNSNKTYKIMDDSDSIKIMIASDLRFGSIYSQPSLYNEICTIAHEQGVKHFIINGDIVEGMYKGKKDVLNQTLFVEGYDDQADYVSDILPRIDGIHYYIITGEHDLSFLTTKAKVDIGKLIADKREDVTYLGQKLSTIAFTNSSNSNEIKIDLRHHIGKIPYTISYKPQQIISSYRNEDKPDILICSHFLACDSFLRRGVRELQIPSLVATTDEMRMQNTPVYNTLGAWVLTLNKDQKGKLESTSQFLIPYYKTILDDYKTCKPLVISDKKVVPVQNKKRTKSEYSDKIYRAIKNGDKVDKILSKFNLDELDFNGLVEEMKFNNNDIDIIEEEGIKKIYKRQNYRRNKSIKTPLSELEHLKLVFISDTHCCSKTEQKSFTEEVLEEGYENGYKTFLHFGDIVDGDYHNRADHRYSLHKSGFTEQCNYVVNDYFPVSEHDDIEYYYITGSHDWTHMMNGGADIGKEIEEKRSDMHYLGNDIGIYKVGVNKNSKIEMYHSGGGCASSLSYKPQKFIDKMEPGTKPNVLGMGHFHQSYMTFYRNVVTFLVPCLVSKTGFAKRQGLENTMGAYYVDLYLDKNGEVEYLSFVEKRFEESDVLENDYEEGHRLILK